MKKNLITSALFLSLSSLAFAQSEQLEPIYVYSAYAAPINQDQTASSVTVLTEQDFAQRNATYVSDVLNTVPSVAVRAVGGRGTLTNAYLRGTYAKHTAVVIDGVKVNGIASGGFDFGGLPLSNIERIEVLRGEQSALYGSDAMGGVIYITTKSGLYKEKPFNLDVNVGTGSNGTVEGAATISGYHNGFYYALHGDSHRTRGISAYSANKFRYTAENGTNITTGGATERDKFHRDNVSARFGYDDGNKGIEVLGTQASQTARFDSTYMRGEADFDDNTRTRETTFKLGGYVGNDQELFKHQASVSHTKTDSDTFSSSVLYPAPSFLPTTVASRSGYDAKRLNGNYQLDINFDREGSVKQSLSLLGEYQQTKYASTAYATAKEKQLIERSVAGEYRLFTEEDHSLSVGGRYTDSSDFKNAFTGRIAGAYRLSPNLRAHASFGTAIQYPTMIEYFGYSGTYIGNPNLKAERSRGGDVGLLIESSDKKQSLDVTYFARNIDRKIQDNSTWTQAVNIEGTSKVRGVEIAYKGQFTDKFSAFANYTYTQAKDAKKLTLIRIPKQSANVGVVYQLTDKIGTNANVTYVGSRIDGYYDSNSFSTLRVRMPSYTLVNLGANYQVSKNLNVYVNLNNLFNKKYENTIEYGQDGRNVYVGLKGSF